MEYGKFQNFASKSYHFNFLEYGIFQKTGTKKFLKSVEYGIFAEYSKKIVEQSKYPKFWNFMEYSWNIP